MAEAVVAWVIYKLCQTPANTSEKCCTNTETIERTRTRTAAADASEQKTAS